MFYNKIHTKLKSMHSVFTLFLAILYITTFSSCMTTHNYSEFPDSFDTVSTSGITKIELKSGLFIDCADKIIIFETGADSVKYIVIKSYSDVKGNSTYWTERRISEKDIYKIFYETSKINGSKTVLLVLGIVIAGLIAAFFIALSSSSFSPGGFR